MLFNGYVYIEQKNYNYSGFNFLIVFIIRFANKQNVEGYTKGLNRVIWIKGGETPRWHINNFI